MRMGYLSGGMDWVHLVVMRSKSSAYEWKGREFRNEGRTLVTGKSYGSG
jgi:hypothetical protein